MILHTINKSKDTDLVKQCARYCSKDDLVLLVEDGVYLLDSFLENCFEGLSESFLKSGQIYALKEDMEFRGIQIDKISSAISIIDRKKYVSLTADSDKVINWL